MRRTARPYLAALLLGALLIPTGPLVSQASVAPSVAFLAAVHTEALARNAFGALLPGSTVQAKLFPEPGANAASDRPQPEPAAAPPATHTLTVQRAPVRQPAQRTQNASIHVVAAGDTLWSLARRYGTTVAAFTQANGLSETATLRLGQRLAVGRTSGSRAVAARSTGTVATAAAGPSLTIIVGSGQTLFSIGRAYGVTTDALVAANNLRSAHMIRAGQRLVIPGRSAARATVVLPPSRVQAAIPAPDADRPLASALQRGFFRWPARGILTSRFGMRWRRHHNGIDIAAPRGTPIYAARAGVVTFSGWYYGYGLAVMISHGGGIVSIYGHASALLVRSGQAVSVGQQIARVGCTGSCTGSHVHFEVRVNGGPVNPLRYL